MLTRSPCFPLLLMWMKMMWMKTPKLHLRILQRLSWSNRQNRRLLPLLLLQEGLVFPLPPGYLRLRCQRGSHPSLCRK
jgi:hypothetical protein